MFIRSSHLCTLLILLLAHVGHSARDPFAGGDDSLRTGKKGGTSKRIALLTPYGRIVLRLIPSNAPKATAALERQAAQGRCDGCNFYRAEARPNVSKGQDSLGPPYALLQGQLTLPNPVELEGSLSVKAGHVAFIPGSKDFFIALGDHSEWGTAHTVVAEIEDFVSTDLIAIQPFHEITHEEYGTVMRMMNDPVNFSISADVAH